jgi:hypothetical protein
MQGIISDKTLDMLSILRKEIRVARHGEAKQKKILGYFKKKMSD